MTEQQIAWRNESYGYDETLSAEGWQEYLAWLDSQPDHFDAPPDNPEDAFALVDLDGELPF